MSAPVIAAFFALTAAVSWGSGDFTSGLSTRRIGAYHTLLISFFFGLLMLTALALAVGEPFSSPRDLFWGVLAGTMGTAGFICMLQGFAIGRMSIVAPVSAVVAAVIPVVVGALGEGMPRAIQLVGFLLAFVSIWLLSTHSETEKRPSGFGLALLAGLGFGAFFTALDQIGETAVFWPLVASRFFALIILLAIALFTRRKLIPAQPPMGLLILAGVLDVSGNFFFLHAIRTGRLDIASVLVSLYPAVTVLLAALIIKEHLNRVQLIGVILAVSSIALITI